ncbi:MAG: PD-(D/E)XK motif protein [Solirubrobacteraceae bacterium]|nr:PD-(D/E)XK motif protein [Solirubrobacteraceae bacterium]
MSSHKWEIMRISEVLAATWDALKDESFSLPGYYERRVFADSAHSLFVGITRPSNLLQLCMDVSIAQAGRVVEDESKGFRLRREESPTAGKARLRLELTTASYGDIFLVVSSDILTKILQAHDEQEAIVALRRRIEHWRRFMQASGPDGLSRFEQIGLFGELLVLRSLLKVPNNNEDALISWLGPKGANQDFILRDRAIEVKTTTGNEPTRVQISNERQLDTRGLALLILCHICVDERIKSGTTLPALVEQISHTLAQHHVHLFLDCLLAVGYHDSQRHLYLDAGFIERDRNYYQVTGDFPRLTTADLRDGVSEVRYQVDLSSAAPLKVSESQVIASFFRDGT